MNLQTALGIFMFLVLFVGLIQCFLGFRLIKPVVTMIGFFIGAGLPTLVTTMDLFDFETSIVILVGLVGGVLGAITALALHYLAVFMLGFVFGSLIGFLFSTTIGLEESAMAIALGITGLIGGGLSIVYRRWVVIISTSFVGAFSTILGISYFTSGISPDTVANVNPGIMVLGLIIGGAGIFVQHKYTAELDFKALMAKGDKVA